MTLLDHVQVSSTYTPAVLPVGSSGGSGQQVFTFSAIAPGSGPATFGYGSAPPPLPPPHPLSRVCTVASAAGRGRAGLPLVLSAELPRRRSWIPDVYDAVITVDITVTA